MSQPTPIRSRIATIVAWIHGLSLVVVEIGGGLSANAVRAGESLERLTEPRLAEVRKSLEQLAQQRRDPMVKRPWRHHRANLHVHSSLSHDSRGEIQEIVAAAKKVGATVLMFTEHPADSYDYFRDGHQGLRDGVLLIPGAETRGLLVFPRDEVLPAHDVAPQELAQAIHGRGGLTFLSHLEERLDWQLRALTGVEIYNTHADFKEDKALVAALRNPLWVLKAAELFRKYPQEAFSALQDYPADYLTRWDTLCQTTPHVGVAANDSHQNIGIVLRLNANRQIIAEDAGGKKLFEVDARWFAALLPVPADAKAGAVLFRTVLDPYEQSLRHVGTHLLLKEHTVDAVRDALARGRVYVAFDWLADSAGFDCVGTTGEQRIEMGESTTWRANLKLSGAAPLVGQWRVFRDGRKIHESQGETLDYAISSAGVYRVEVWLEVAAESRLWILSNPIYVRNSGS